MRSEREKEFEGSHGGLCLGYIVRSRVMVEGDLRVEIGRILSPLYLNLSPGFNFMFWLTWLINEDKINLSFYKICLLQ